MKKFKLLALSLSAVFAASIGCGTPERAPESSAVKTTSSPQIIRKLETLYANYFDIEYYDDGTCEIGVRDERNKLAIVPENVDPKRYEAPGRVVVKRPLDDFYIAATSVNDFFLRLDSLDKIACTSAKGDEHTIPEMVERVKTGKTAYVGKYGSPEFETILARQCGLAIESTMIYHSPKTKEQLERLGVPVFVERAIYEEEPLGRLEWIKLYGAMLGKEKEADAYFESQRRQVEAILAKRSETEQRKKVALFYVTTNGYVNVRRPGDFYCKLVEIAGGKYAFDALVEAKSSQSSISVNWEDFYRAAVDADVIVYNGNVDTTIESVADLLEKNPLFADFKAVKNGAVWRSNVAMYQETSKTAEIVQDFYDALNSPGELDSKYLTKLK